MSLTQRILAFVIACGVAAVFLHIVPVKESQVAGLQLERRWDNAKSTIRPLIQDSCTTLTPTQESLFGKTFLAWLNLPAPISLVGARNCHLLAHSARNRVFLFKTMWVVQMQVVGHEGKTLLKQQYQVETPRPLCFLPLLIFLLGLLLDIPVGGLKFLMPTYLFLLAGANLIRMAEISSRSALLAVSEKNFVGLCLIAIWLAFILTRDKERQQLRAESTARNKGLNRLLTSLIGLWNPLVYSLFGRTVLKHRRWLFTFFDAQFLLACLSLYLFQYEFGNRIENLRDSLVLPRYFSFAALVYLGVNAWLKPHGRHNLIWTLPSFWRAVAFVGGFEIAYALQFPIADNTLTRMGVALALSELVWPVGVDLKRVARNGTLWIAAIFLSYFVGMMSIEAGVVDLGLVSTNPRIHPRFLAIFTFFAGSILGFLTGAFSFAFLPLFLFMKSPAAPLIEGALLDGILAGTLASPFSLFNLVPAVQFNVKLKQLVAYRFRQLSTPFLVASLIYFIASLNSVAILRPTTFVFCCLVVVAWQLRRSAWDLRRSRHLLAAQGMP